MVADYGVAMDGSNPSSDVADSVVKEIEAGGGNAIAVAGDVSKFQTGADIVAAAVDTWGAIDGVVDCRGRLRQLLPLCWPADVRAPGGRSLGDPRNARDLCRHLQ